MTRRSAVALLALLGGCRGDTGFAVALTVEPGCAAAATRLRVEVRLAPSGRSRTVEIAESPLFPGGRRRLVILPGDQATAMTVGLEALAGEQSLGRTALDVEVGGHRLVERSANFVCPVDGPTGDAGAGDLGAAGDLTANRDRGLDDGGGSDDAALPGDAAIVDGAIDQATVDLLRADAPAVDLAAAADLAQLKVVAVSVTPTKPQLPKGTKLQMKATATFSDQTTRDVTQLATWQSDDTLLATVGDAAPGKGLLAAVAPGTAIITATWNGSAGLTAVNVTSATLTSLAISPANPTLAKGSSLQLTASGLFSDNSTQDLTATVVWSSTDGGVADVANAPGKSGLLTARGPGSATISAVAGNIVGTTTVTTTAAVLSALTITPANPALAKGSTLQLQATATYSDNTIQDLTNMVTWSSSDDTVSKIDPAGLLVALAPGTATIKATLGMAGAQTQATVSAAVLKSIAVSGADLTMAKGTKQQLTAVGTYSDNSTQELTNVATWGSSNDQLVAVSNAQGSQGLVTALDVGMADLTATSAGVKGQVQLTVSAATLTAIEVTPSDPTIAKGTKQQLRATGVFSDKSTQDLTSAVSWSSSKPNVASVSSAMGSIGLATALEVGATAITAASGNVAGTVNLTVTDALLTKIEISPADVKLPKGVKQDYGAGGTYSDGSVQDVTGQVTWASSDPKVATISNALTTRGQLTAVAVGAAGVTATLGGIVGQGTVTVTSATLTRIDLTPVNPSLAQGTAIQLTATGTFSDNSTQNLTGASSWASADSNLAVASSTAGLIVGVKAGSVAVSAKYAGVTGTTTLKVTNAVPTLIEVTPAQVSLIKTETRRLKATATFNDMTKQDITLVANWSSTNPLVATVSNAPGSHGLVTCAGAGLALISAAFRNAVVKPATVSGATIQMLRVTPHPAMVQPKQTVQLTATAFLSNNTQVNVTDRAAWSVSAPAIATIDNQAAKGLVTGVVRGNTTASAAFLSASGSASIVVQ